MNPDFEIIEVTTYKVIRCGELVAELTSKQWNVCKQVAQATKNKRVEGIRLLRNISRLLPDDPWDLKCCRDLLDAAQANF